MTTVAPEIVAVVSALQLPDNPTFQGGSVQTAVATLSNPTAAQFTYVVELYLNVLKLAGSGLVTVVIPAGGSVSIPLTVTMPLVQGTYEVYLDVKVDNVLIKHFRATQDVTIEITPDIDIISITW